VAAVTDWSTWVCPQLHPVSGGNRLVVVTKNLGWAALKTEKIAISHCAPTCQKRSIVSFPAAVAAQQ
jgi:hypothetical protein